MAEIFSPLGNLCLKGAKKVLRLSQWNFTAGMSGVAVVFREAIRNGNLACWSNWARQVEVLPTPPVRRIAILNGY
jgi:hypothetical protein